MLRDLIIYTPMYVSFFWAVVLLSSRNKNNIARQLLGVFMVVAAVLYFSHAVFFQELTHLYRIIDPVYIFVTLAVYPLYYWYIKLLSTESEYKWYNLRLLIPSALFSSISFILYRLMNDAETEGYIQGFLYGHPELYPESTLAVLQKWNYILCRVVFTVQVVVFLIFGHRLVTHYNNRIANFYSNLESKSLVWVKFILYSLVLTSIMSITLNIMGRSTFIDSSILLLIPSAIFSGLLFFVGFSGYMQNYTVVELDHDMDHVVSAIQKRINAGHFEKKLLSLFNEKMIYRNHDLKITDVAKYLGSNRTYVSEFINNRFSCSFVEFVNRFRLSEAKLLLKNNSEVSVHEVAEQAGFGSTGTFIRVFKNQEGMTPGRYRDVLIPSAGSPHGIGYGVDTVKETVQ